MMTTTNQYNLTAKSKSGLPGFESYKHQNGQYYFHFNDEEGNALLYSQAYGNTGNSEKGLQSVTKSGRLKKRYALHKDDQSYYYVLKAGNHREIARSRLFKSKKAAEEAQRFIIDFLTTDAADIRPSTNMASTPPDPTTPPALDETRSVMPPAKIETSKYPFRIDLYRQKENQILTGKIEYLPTREKQAFNGLDMVCITDFMVTHIPGAKPKKLPNIHKRERHMAKKLEKATIHENLQLQVSSVSNELLVENYVQATVPFKVGIRWATMPTTKEGNGYFVNVTAKKIIGQKEFLLTGQELKQLEAKLDLRIDRNTLAPGLYRIIARMTPENTSNNQKPEVTGYGSCLLQVG